MTVAPYADALARAATDAMRQAVAGDDAALLEAVKHMSPGERLNIYRAARRLADVCGATADNHPNPETPPLFGVLAQQYAFEIVIAAIDFVTHHRNLQPPRRKRVDFVRNSIVRQLQQQGVAMDLFKLRFFF
ncbi:MAG TPA: hypothetical protein VF761_16945 [Gemmatimonadaceae bacterium]